jgi:hypothetical protein
MAASSTSDKIRQPEVLHQDDERWQLVLRIASSPQFRRAHRLRDFLLYVTDRAIEGDTERLSEYQIGQAVFEKGKNYSPAEDNVVRAHARLVRAKLAEYFAESGKQEPLLLEVPKGSYAPVFSRREEPALSPVPIPAPLLSVPQTLSHPAPSRPQTAWQKTALALSILSLAALVACAYLWTKNNELERAAKAKKAAAPSETATPPLSWVFDNRAPTTVVVADTSFGLIQDAQKRTALLEDYLSPNFYSAQADKPGSETLQAMVQRLKTRQFTSFADLILSERILQMAGPFREATTVRSARDLRMRDLSNGNFIFLGSSYSNPWVSLFAKKRNFFVSLDAATRRGIVTNKHPHSGESDVYVMKGEDGVTGPTYGVISFLPADADTGSVLIAEGINMEGTEAAGAYLTTTWGLAGLRKALKLDGTHTAKTAFEILLETRVVGGATRDTRIVAIRKGDSQ